MTLQDIYDQLTYGELSNVFLAKRSRDDQVIEQDDFMKLLPHVQLGLNSIHTRMFLREGTEIFALEDGKVSYLVSPVDENILEIEAVKGMYCAKEYTIPLDELENPESIRRTSFNTFTVPDDETMAPWLAETTELTVIYRANHPVIKDYIANSAPLITPIYLPATHLYALTLFIASRVHAPMGMRNEFHEANNYNQMYEMEMARLEAFGFSIDTTYQSTRLDDAGMP